MKLRTASSAATRPPLAPPMPSESAAMTPVVSRSAAVPDITGGEILVAGARPGQRVFAHVDQQSGAGGAGQSASGTRELAAPWSATCKSLLAGVARLLTRGLLVINRDFLKAGHLPTLLAAFFYFDMSFMVWVMLGALAVQMSADCGLSPAQKGFMVALPVLAGALLRVVIGVLVDRLGRRRAGIIGQVVVIVGLVAAWLSASKLITARLWLGLDSRRRRRVVRRGAAARLALVSAAVPGHRARHRRRRQFRHRVRLACSRRAWRRGSAGTTSRPRRRCRSPSHSLVYLFAAKDSADRAAAEDLDGIPRRARRSATPGGSCSSTP